MPTRKLRIRWNRPAIDPNDSVGIDEAAVLGADGGERTLAANALTIPQISTTPEIPLLPRSAIHQLLREWGRIDVEADPADGKRPVTVKEELLTLLRLGAEIEHALCIQYLYALASLKDSGLAATQQARALLLDISMQEMAHLITVQNLLLAVGGAGEFHIGRDAFRAAAGENPMPLCLEPVSHLTLAEYVCAEMPAEVPEGHKVKVQQLQAEVKSANGRDPRRVGAVYARIYWLIQPTDTPTGPIVLHADASVGLIPDRHIKKFTQSTEIKKYQATLPEWVISGPDMLVLSVTDRAEALDAVGRIMEQGEGLAGSPASHFEKFLALVELFEKGGLEILPLPRTPYVCHAPLDAVDRRLLTHPYIFRWALLFNVRYTMLLLEIGHTMATPHSDPDRQSLHDDFVSQTMKFVKRLIGQMTGPNLAKLGASGPTFELIYEDFPTDAVERWRRLQILLQREQQIMGDLQTSHSSELALDPSGKLLLDDLKSDNDGLTPFVASKIPTSTP